MNWDLSLNKQLRHQQSQFALDLHFVSAASRLVLFGPSGAGKTLTLKMMAGIVTPDRGHITIAGRRLYDHGARLDLKPQQRRLAYMFQDYALFPHLTVRQNIAFARQPRQRAWLNPTRAWSDAVVERWIDAFELQKIVSHYPHQISGGQRQRTALARALACAPSALLLDEPFAALDQRLRQSLRDELRDLQAQLKLPMLLITHDEDDVRALADEVVHLQAGRVVRAAAGATS